MERPDDLDHTNGLIRVIKAIGAPRFRLSNSSGCAALRLVHCLSCAVLLDEHETAR